MDQMFGNPNVNPGLASRFDKRRVVFLPWTWEQAVDVVVQEIKKDSKDITAEAVSVLGDYCRALQVCNKRNGPNNEKSVGRPMWISILTWQNKTVQ